MIDRIFTMCQIGDVGEDRALAAGGPWSFSNYADRAIRTATIAYTGCHTPADTRIQSRIRTHSDTRADVPCD